MSISAVGHKEGLLDSWQGYGEWDRNEMRGGMESPYNYPPLDKH